MDIKRGSKGLPNRKASSCRRDERGTGISMSYSRGTAKTVLSEPGNIKAINTSPVDESVAFVYLDGHRV